MYITDTCHNSLDIFSIKNGHILETSKLSPNPVVAE